jgi:hypothetical protein
MSRVLVAGVPRSGTTWVGDVLGRSPGVRLISEPDNLHVDPLAGAATRPFGRFPVLRPGEPGGLYATLWTLAFRGGWPWAGTVTLSRRVASRFSPRACYRLLGPAARACALRPPYPGDVVVKTVYGVLSLEWIAEHTGARILVVRRNLLDTVASWLALHAPGYPLAAETPRAGNVTGNEPMAARGDRRRLPAGAIRGHGRRPRRPVGLSMGRLSWGAPPAARTPPLPPFSCRTRSQSPFSSHPEDPS